MLNSIFYFSGKKLFVCLYKSFNWMMHFNITIISQVSTTTTNKIQFNTSSLIEKNPNVNKSPVNNWHIEKK